MNDSEKVICPSVKFAMKVLTTERIKMGGNDSAAKTASGTAFREAAKTGQSRNSEFVYDYMRITISNSVMPYSEQSLLYSVSIFGVAKSHAKQRN